MYDSPSFFYPPSLLCWLSLSRGFKSPLDYTSGYCSSPTVFKCYPVALFCLLLFFFNCIWTNRTKCRAEITFWWTFTSPSIFFLFQFFHYFFPFFLTTIWKDPAVAVTDVLKLLPQEIILPQHLLLSGKRLLTVELLQHLSLLWQKLFPLTSRRAFFSAQEKMERHRVFFCSFKDGESPTCLSSLAK